METSLTENQIFERANRTYKKQCAYWELRNGNGILMKFQIGLDTVRMAHDKQPYPKCIVI